MTTRAVLALCTIATALLAAPPAQAQSATAAYPSRPITLIVPYAAGGVADATARLIGQKLQDAWKQSVLIENRTGGGGLIGAGAAARAPADGYTLLLGVSGLVLQPQLVEKPPYDPFRDFTPVTMIARLPVLLAVPKTGPIKSVESFVALAKADPLKYSIGNYGVGTPSHLLSIMFNAQSGLDLPLIPYQGSSPLAASLLGGQVSAGFIDSVTATLFVDKLTFLGVTGAKRVHSLPNLATFAELGYRSFEQDGWLGVLVPAATPPAITAQLSNALMKIIAAPEVSKRIENMGITPVGSTAAEFGKVMRTDSDVYGKVIHESNIRIN